MSGILVTGASGFIGRALVNDLAAGGRKVRAAMRQPADIFPRPVEVVAVSDMTRPVDWRILLQGMDTVVHLAGIAHTGPDIAEEAYDRVNRIATAALAEAVRPIGTRVIFISSIRAQSGPSASSALTEADTPQPTDAYGRSKLAAERAVRAAQVPFTILRPVLIYGPGVKGNLASLLQLARSPWPLPFGSLRNRRSLLARENLIAAVHLALNEPAMSGETYVVADPAPLTLAEMIAAIRAGIGRPPRTMPFPPALLARGLRIIGREEIWRRIGGGLVADPAKLLRMGWSPPVDTRAGLAAMARAMQA